MILLLIGLASPIYPFLNLLALPKASQRLPEAFLIQFQHPSSLLLSTHSHRTLAGLSCSSECTCFVMCCVLCLNHLVHTHCVIHGLHGSPYSSLSRNPWGARSQTCSLWPPKQDEVTVPWSEYSQFTPSSVCRTLHSFILTSCKTKPLHINLLVHDIGNVLHGALNICCWIAC